MFVYVAVIGEAGARKENALPKNMKIIDTSQKFFPKLNKTKHEKFGDLFVHRIQKGLISSHKIDHKFVGYNPDCMRPKSKSPVIYFEVNRNSAIIKLIYEWNAMCRWYAMYTI